MNARAFTAIATLYRMELRALLRDRRTILLSVVLPLLFMPLILLLSSRVKQSSVESAERKSHSYAVFYGAQREKAEPLLKAALSNPSQAAPEGEDPSPLVETDVPDPEKALLSGSIDAYIKAA